MKHEFWHQKWETNQIGFHQQDGHVSLSEYFPKLKVGARVLVPLCGKSVDMLWLAEQGYAVTGVELSGIAVENFFSENDLAYEISEHPMNGVVFKKFTAKSGLIELYVGDFMAFNAPKFDALYDRAALIALPESMRSVYVERCKELLISEAQGLVITTVYDERLASGPPFSVSDSEVESLWMQRLLQVKAVELIDEEPRWKSKGLASFQERLWVFV